MKRGEKLFDFVSTPEEMQTALQLKHDLQNGKNIPFIAFGIGGKKDVCRWPLERYDEIIHRLKQDFDFIPVYLGGPDERAAAQNFIQKHGGCFLLDSSCNSLRKTIAFLRYCSCYIGNDTGSVHLAATAGIPCAAIFPAQDIPPMRWHPFSRNSFELYSALRNWTVLKEFFAPRRQGD